MKGKVFCVMPLIPQNGAKYITCNLAYFTQKQFKNKKVLMIDFDLENPVLGYHFIEDHFRGLEGLVPHAYNLNLEVFKANINKTSIGVELLKGSSLINTLDNNLEKFIAQIINMAKQLYDYIYIVVNNKVNSSISAMSLLNADRVVLVVRNNYANMLKINKTINQTRLFFRRKEPICIIYNYGVNHCINVSNGIKDKNVKVLGIVNYVPKTVENINLENKFFLKKRTANDRLFKEIVRDFAKGG